MAGPSKIAKVSLQRGEFCLVLHILCVCHCKKCLVFRPFAKITRAFKPQHTQSRKPKHWDVEEVVLWEGTARAAGS